MNWRNACIVAFVACIACTRPPDSPRVRIAVGGQADLVYLPVTLAAQLGYYREEGLDIELQDTGAGSKSLIALLGGSADVVSGFYDHAIQMAAQRRDVRAFVTMVRYPGAVLIASPSSRHKVGRIEDLKGAVVGVTSPGSSSAFFVNHLLIHHGMALDDVSIVATGGGASRVMAIERGKVDAGVLFEPGVTRLLSCNCGPVILADTRNAHGVREVYGVSEYPASVLYTKGSWLARNPHTAARLAHAIRRTLEFLQRQDASQIASHVPANLRGRDLTVYIEALRHTLPTYSPDGRMPSEGARAVQQVLELSVEKVRLARIDLESTYTNEFVK